MVKNKNIAKRNISNFVEFWIRHYILSAKELSIYTKPIVCDYELNTRNKKKVDTQKTTISPNKKQTVIKKRKGVLGELMVL